MKNRSWLLTLIFHFVESTQNNNAVMQFHLQSFLKICLFCSFIYLIVQVSGGRVRNLVLILLNCYFVLQLCSLYSTKPPISKTKMVELTKLAMKAAKFYKHVVQSIEKFINKVRILNYDVLLVLLLHISVLTWMMDHIAWLMHAIVV